jgi:hypothetical protein
VFAIAIGFAFQSRVYPKFNPFLSSDTFALKLMLLLGLFLLFCGTTFVQLWENFNAITLMKPSASRGR